MLKKSFKLKSKDKEISFVLKKGNEIHNNNFTIRFLRSNKAKNQYAVVIGNKISKQATVRNKIRRRIFHIIHKHNNMHQYPPYKIVILPRRNVIESSFMDIENSLTTLLDKINT